MHASPLQPPPTSALRPHTARSEPIDVSDERRRRDEERLREIYGDTPPPPQDYNQHEPPTPSSSMHAQPTSSRPRHPDSYIPPPTPRSPSEEARERRDTRRRAYQGASLPDLVLEAVRLLMRDPKNVAIVVMFAFVLHLVLRPAAVVQQAPIMDAAVPEYHFEESKVDSVVPTVAVVGSTDGLDEDVMPSVMTTSSFVESLVEISSQSASTSPSPSPIIAEEESPVLERKIVKVVETVTETVRVSEPADAVTAEPPVEEETVYETETIKVTVSASEEVEEPLASVSLASVPLASETPVLQMQTETDSKVETELVEPTFFGPEPSPMKAEEAAVTTVVEPLAGEDKQGDNEKQIHDEV
jgi:hypothetical protein